MSFGVELYWPASLAVAFAVAAVAAHLVAYRRAARPASGVPMRLLEALRLAALALVLFALWRPAEESFSTLSRKARLVLLVDTSKSMSIGDEEMGAPPAPVSRLARAAGVFSENKDLWKQVVDAYDVSAYSFSGTLSRMDVAPGELGDTPGFGTMADGPVTAIGDALREGARLAGAPEAMVIVSDGLNNAGTDPFDAASPTGTPIYAISVGKSDPGASTRDVAVNQVLAPPEAFVASEVPVVATLTLTGVAGRPVTVVFKVNGTQVGSQVVTTELPQAGVEARFSFVPDKAGPARVEVDALTLPDEIVASNNSVATYVDAKNGTLTALYLEGSFRWEAKFIRLALESAKDIDLRFMTPKGADDATAKALAGNWDVLIIGDLPASMIPAAALEEIVNAVSAGAKGVLFLGGNDAFGRGGYAATPLAQLMPFGIASGEDIDRGAYTLVPQAVGPNAGIIAIGPNGSAGGWGMLPPLMSLNLVGAPKPGAAVLISASPVVRDPSSGAVEGDASRKPAPALAVEEFGKGRTAAMTADGTWQWVTGAGLADEAARDAAAEAHRRFWRQLVFWLARRDQTGEITIKLTLPRHRVDLGEAVAMEAQLLDQQLKAITDADLTAEASSQGKTITGKFRLEGNHYAAELEHGTGDYDVKVVASRGGAKIAECSSAFVAAATDVEFATLVARPTLLEGLARITGGRYAPAADARDVFADAVSRAKNSSYERLQRRQLWSSWWYLGLIIALLAAEWWLRKKHGLV